MEYGEKATTARALLTRIESEIEGRAQNVSRLDENLVAYNEARSILNQLAQTVQAQIGGTIQDRVGSALGIVFGEEYDFGLKYEHKRGKYEAIAEVLRNGEPRDPRRDVGGGIVDIIAFILRLLFRHMDPRRTANVIVLDEPFKFVSKDYLPEVVALLREVVDQLGVQLIMVSHDVGLIEAADVAYNVGLKNGVSVITVEGD